MYLNRLKAVIVNLMGSHIWTIVLAFVLVNVSSYRRDDIASIIADERFKRNMSDSEMAEFIKKYFSSVQIYQADVTPSTTKSATVVDEITSTTAVMNTPSTAMLAEEVTVKSVTLTSEPNSYRWTGSSSSTIKSVSAVNEFTSVTTVMNTPPTTILAEEEGAVGSAEAKSIDVLKTSPLTVRVTTEPNPYYRWTGFTCHDKSHGGYYADVASKCKYFHVCVFYKDYNSDTNKSDVRISKYLMQCPPRTAYSQRMRVCDFEENVQEECKFSSRFYHLESRWFD